MKYLVNRETKEHFLPNYQFMAACAPWEVVEADADGWIPWNGGDCPLPGDAMCEVKTYGGGLYFFERPENYQGDWAGYIIAYRPIIAEKQKSGNHFCEDQKQVTAAAILKTAIGHMEERAVTYDNPQGERSMGKTVAMFNTMTGHELTEEHGWLFMACLKMVRSQQGRYRADSYEDGAAYFALAGEIAAQERV